ncbi:urea carboxylase [Croceivirga lutea]|uniref:5-oxoprolinase subunit C family protein n=1 Tax=Croceivirga lutea TaxID=1775167 RepID=UPI0016395838|nr:biotin-dependent carboxyltransferase family protein [Croceivirga lutea]GGG46212.1 urea carboxylase [Croceivirga lutea]
MLKILKPGFYTTLQDKGRFGYRNMGVPVSGCMDAVAPEKCNLLLENSASAAVLEITMTGPTAEFEEPTFISLGGAKVEAFLNEESLELYKIYQVNKGDKISFGKLKLGFRNYLAVKGGFTTTKTLESVSQHHLITAEASIKANDEVPYNGNSDFSPKVSELRIEDYLNEVTLEVFKGPEFSLLSKKQKEQLLDSDFTVAKENNRMAYQLEETIEEHTHSILTSATLPGTIQLTPNGKLIVLMRDGQTTGGYPRILQLSEKAISVLAQKRAGNKVKLKLV